MRVNVNGEMLSEDIHRIEWCNGDMNSNFVTEHACTNADVHIDLLYNLADTTKEYIMSVIGMF